MNDGFAFSYYIFSLSAEKVSQTPLFSVIKLKEVKRAQQNGKKLILILDFEIIYDNIQEIIGAPIDYKEYLRKNRINLDGNTSIPYKYLQKNSKTEENNDFIEIKKEEFEQSEINNEQKIPELSQKTAHFFETPLKIPKKEEKNISEKIPEKNPTIEKTIENHRKSFLDKFKVIFT